MVVTIMVKNLKKKLIKLKSRNLMNSKKIAKNGAKKFRPSFLMSITIKKIIIASFY